MARVSRKKNPLTLAFIGSGEVSAKNVKALITELVESRDNQARFIVPVTKTHWNETMETIVELAGSLELPYEVVVDDTTEKLRGVKTVLNGAEKEHKVVRVPNKLVALLEKEADGRLIIAWDDDDEDAGVAFDKAYDKEIAALDLTTGLEPLERAEEDEPGKGETEKGDDDNEETPTGEADEEEKPDDDEEEKPYTEAELNKLDIDQLKEIVKANPEITVPPRSRTGTYVKAILDFQAGSDNGGGEKFEPPADEDVALPQSEALQAQSTGMQPNGYFWVSGSCPICGSPIFAPQATHPETVKAVRTCPEECKYTSVG